MTDDLEPTPLPPGPTTADPWPTPSTEASAKGVAPAAPPPPGGVWAPPTWPVEQPAQPWAAPPPPPWAAPTPPPAPPWAAPTPPPAPPWAAPTAPAPAQPWAAPSAPTPPPWGQPAVTPDAGAAAPSGTWTPPPGPQPAGSWGGGWSPPPAGWPPPPADPWGRAPGGQWSPPPRRPVGFATIAVFTAAVLVAALFGVGVGRAINHGRTSSAATFPLQPSTGLGGGFGSGSQGSSGSSGSGSTGSSTLGNAALSAVESGMVDIDTKLGYQSATAAGTGMILTSNGEILTNNHVIDGATDITATVVSTGKTYTAKVVGTDVTGDVAVLQLDGASGLHTIPLGNSSSVASGASVVALGNAGGVGGAPSVVSGTVQATGQAITASDQGGANAEQLSDLIETDAPIQPGDSGGPLVNAAGKVVGMDTAASSGNRFQAAADVAFAIPINDALSIVSQIEAGKASATIHLGLPGFLGVEIDATGTLGGGTASGAVVSGVVSGSPAAKAGIRGGDVITAVDGQTITTPASLTTQLQGHHAGDKVSVTWADSSGASHTATITLMTGPAN